MSRKLVVFFTAACLVLSYGCAQVNKQVDAFRSELQPKKEITDNIFYLSSPEIRLKIVRDLKFIGKVKRDEPIKQDAPNRIKDPLEDNFRSTSYIFGQIGTGNVFQRGIIIRIHTVMGDPSQATPVLFPREDKLESGEVKILDENYQYFTLASPDAFLKHERHFLSNFSIPNCFLVKCLEKRGSFGNKTKIQILYIEEISLPDLQCSQWTDAGSLSEIQRLSLDDFIDRSYNSIRFMEEKKIVDKTSKYVDAKEEVYGEDTAPPYIDTGRGTLHQSSPAETGSGDIEKRLQTLKELLDKGLITQEDYDQKKTQILENL
ncbi:MAG TPA: SHOCT domain-containing protein [Syntrophales bacterium]|nr:SHOCT domain-containing protein [Syntrophales bacterium]HPQ44885.1 SHOCT domain-containing protein [Syntrophales bacterium]